MRAVILVGGEGTRLRPLTSELPKPAVKLVDRPMMAFMLEWLAANGIAEVVMACGFKPDAMREALGDGGRFGLQISYVTESEPLGTGGALRFADEQLPDGLGERFVMCNGDILTDLNLAAQITRHRELGAQVTPRIGDAMNLAIGADAEGFAQGARIPFVGLHLTRAAGVHRREARIGDDHGVPQRFQVPGDPLAFRRRLQQDARRRSAAKRRGEAFP